MNDISDNTKPDHDLANTAGPPDWHGYRGGQTWISSGRPVARAIGAPIRRFLHVEAASGVVLLVATIAALILANTPIGPRIADFWHQELTLFEIGNFHLVEDLGHWVNDGLMVIFFFVVGLEIKGELVNGELKDPRRAAVPAIAALGGMVVPAAFYLLLNAGGAGSDGWGIPMATDIAFAVSVLTVLGSRVPGPLKVFLLTLAIVDDIGAILVIAIFYTEQIAFDWLIAAALLIALVIGMRVARIWYTPLYVVVGILVWVAFLESGVHATIAGVILGLLAPAKPLRPAPTEVRVESDSSWEHLRSTVFDAQETVPVVERLQHILHPWSAFVVLPVFAFANAGIVLSGEVLHGAFTAAVPLGVMFGLVVGKPVGVLIATFIATKVLRIGTLPVGVTWRHVIGAGALAGIGFTVSLFVTGLAFSDEFIVAEAKIGILIASVAAAVVGALILSTGHHETKSEPSR